MFIGFVRMRSHIGHSPTPTTRTRGRPTSTAHMRVVSVSTQGLPRPDEGDTAENRRAPAPRPGPRHGRQPALRSFTTVRRPILTALRLPFWMTWYTPPSLSPDRSTTSAKDINYATLCMIMMPHRTYVNIVRPA